jgi:molecular chaperone GrpE
VADSTDLEQRNRHDPANPPVGGSADNAGAAGAPAGEDELTALRRECESLRDKNLRLLADARNLQQRTARDREEAIRYAEFDFARELLPVLDGLEQTLASAQTATDPRAVAEGIRIVYEQFLKALKSRQIEPLDVLGAAFDPAMHEALLQQPSADQAPGTVLQEVQRGYRMRDRVLRFARVIVARAAE